jgi:hypothetical protein
MLDREIVARGVADSEKDACAQAAAVEKKIETESRSYSSPKWV